MTWQPGEMLSVSGRHGPQPLLLQVQPSQSGSMSKIQNMLPSIQGCIEKCYSNGKTRLSDLEARTSGVGEKEEQFVHIASMPTSSFSENQLGRKQQSPAEVKVCCHSICSNVYLMPFLMLGMRFKTCMGL